jgi:hypothetical protein
MANGKVVTNPGKLNPDIAHPEGPVDREIQVVRITCGEHLTGVIANLTNHTDTIGDDRVSADWPGFLERRLQAALGCQVPVLTLVAPSGNINHFDVSSSQGQTCYAEARRIGEGYADIILRSLDSLTPVAPDPLRVATGTLTLKRRTIPADQLEQARRMLSTAAEATGVFTSEDLARGAAPVLRFFAEQTLAFAGNEAGTSTDYPLVAIGLGRDLALVSMPGEPFTEIGMAVKRESPFPRTLVASNANGYAGYIVLDECFERGGYEPLPVEGGGADRGTAQALQAAALKALRAIAD